VPRRGRAGVAGAIHFAHAATPKGNDFVRPDLPAQDSICRIYLTLAEEHAFIRGQ
jgi:hypothetical protein